MRSTASAAGATAAIQVPAGLADGEYLVIADVNGVYSLIGVVLAVQSQ